MNAMHPMRRKARSRIADGVAIALLGAGSLHAQQRPPDPPQAPEARIVASRVVATENSRQPVQITVQLDAPAPAGGLPILIEPGGGDAQPGVDFDPPPQPPIVPAGATTATVNLMVRDDMMPEPDETVRIVIRPGPGYRVGMPNDFVLTIRDDDDDPSALAARLDNLIRNTPDPLVQSQLAHLAQLCSTSRPPPGSELDRRCQLLRLALRDPMAARQLVDSLRGVIGEELSSQRRGFRMLASGQLGAVARRLEAVRGGSGAGVALSDATYGPLAFLPAAAADDADDDGLLGRGIGLFLSANIGDGERDATDLESGYDSDSQTLLLGIDKRFGDRWVVGLTYARTEFDADLDAGAGSLELEQDGLGLYFSYSFDAGWIDGSAGFGRGQIRQERVASFQATSEEETVNSVDRLLATPDADLRYLTLSAGYDWHNGAWSYGPRLAVEHARFEVDAFAERAISGADAFAVALEAQTLRSLLVRAGGGAAAAYSTSFGVLQPQFEVLWVSQLEDDAEAIGGRFINDPLGARFELPTSAVDDRYGEASLALTALYAGGWSGYFSYRRLFGVDDTEQQFWSAGLRKEF